jgi:hypothetical protein
VLDRYASAEGDIGAPDVWWAVEVHLEQCAACSERLGEVVARVNPATMSLLERVRAELVTEVTRNPGEPQRRRWLRGWLATWAMPAVLSRLRTTLLVVLVAVGLDLANGQAGGHGPSLVLLLAPVAPLLPVAAAWSRRLDPAHELAAASARAGLELVLRRTVAVLVVVIPALGVAGWQVGVSPARWLLPCLAFTAGALALGQLVGLHRAATGLAVAWAVAVVGPSLVTQRPPAALSGASLPAWALATVVITVLLVVFRPTYRMR